jgi:hypothetical protein
MSPSYTLHRALALCLALLGTGLVFSALGQPDVNTAIRLLSLGLLDLGLVAWSLHS